MGNIHERPVCHRAEDLVAYLYGECNEAEARDFADHLRRCQACRAEFAGFKQVHESIARWRNETLGATVGAPAVATALVGRHPQLSAVAAVREFFSVAPLWLRGATAFAGLLLCALALIVISRPAQKPLQATANSRSDEKVYSEKEFRVAVDHEVHKRLALNEAAREILPKPSPVLAQRQPKTVDVIPESAHNGLRNRPSRTHGLTLAEREQLAADLRLVPTKEDDELPFVFSDEPNQ